MSREEIITQIQNMKGLIGDKIHPSIVDRLERGAYPLHKNGACPYLSDEVVYNEHIYTRFKELEELYQNSFGDGPYSLQSLMMILGPLIFQMNSIESVHASDLSDLAVQIIKSEFNLDDKIKFDVELVGMGDVPKPPDRVDEIERDLDEYPPSLDAEIRKRDFINSLSQGASLKGHYIFNLYEDVLSWYNPNLISLYRKLTVANDLLYFLVNDEFIKENLADGDENQAGYVRITFDEDGIPTIEVKAICFPFLIHELIKGVMEIIATVALPDDQKENEIVRNTADDLGGEIWGIRLGPVYWESLMTCIELEDKDLLKTIVTRIYQLSTENFNILFKEINLRSDIAKNTIKGIVQGIRRDINEYEAYLNEVSQQSDAENAVNQLINGDDDEAYVLSDEQLNELLFGDPNENSNDGDDDDGDSNTNDIDDLNF